MPCWSRLIQRAYQDFPLSWIVSTSMHPNGAAQLSPGRCRYRLCFAIWLLPGAAFGSPPSAKVSVGTDGTRPYLLAIGAPALRFREAAEPRINPSMHQPVGAPPQPNYTANSVGAKAPEGRTPSASSLIPLPSSGTPAGSKPAEPAQSGPAPVPILPDENRPKVRPEDFLPYFQFPGSGANPEDVISVPVPPEPGKQPLSTATYRQQ